MIFDGENVRDAYGIQNRTQNFNLGIRETIGVFAIVVDPPDLDLRKYVYTDFSGTYG